MTSKCPLIRQYSERRLQGDNSLYSNPRPKPIPALVCIATLFRCCLYKISGYKRAISVVGRCCLLLNEILAHKISNSRLNYAKVPQGNSR